MPVSASPPDVIIAPIETESVHSLRYTHKGIQILKASGRYRDYMELPTPAHREFIAWDGEGWTDDNLEHHYMLLQCSTGHRIHSAQLASADCLELILRVGAENPKAIHVIYGGGYDATHILRDMPTELQYRLKDDNPVQWFIRGRFSVNYTINYLPHKWLTIKGYCWTAQRYVSVKIFDILTFFQTSFIKALDSRNLSIPDEIRSGKAGRNTFTYDDLEEISLYCQLELEALVALANTLRNEFDDAGIRVTQWHGPGAVANATFKTHNIALHLGTIPPEIERAAQYAYFGGHFEQYKAGHYDGKVYLYDINSAYPHQLRMLPDFAGMEYEHVYSYTGEFGLYRCTYSGSEKISNKPQPLPWRSETGSVGYPTQLSGWYWSFEIPPDAHVLEGYIFRPANDIHPFDYITGMYETRKEWKRIGRNGEKALKLSMNSAYGKVAQRVGSKNGQRPRYHNLSWAGMITAGTRAQLWQAIAQSPNTVIAVETDSIMSTVPLELDIGDNLGQWGLTIHHGVTYIQSGIYFTDDGVGKTKARTRGIDVTQINETQALEWLKDPTDPYLILSRTFVGLGNPSVKTLYGQWQESTKELRVAGQKRIHMPSLCQACARGANLAEALHDLTANPMYGQTMSSPHTLPWIDEKTVTDGGYYPGDSIAEFERRHT